MDGSSRWSIRPVTRCTNCCPTCSALFSAENGLNVLAFPSIGVMQHDIVSNTATLLGADEPGAGGAVEGYLTSGGTESLLQAVKTARDVGRERGIERPSVVAGESAHAAFTKAADYFDVDLVRVPVGADFRGRARRRWRPRAPPTRSWWWLRRRRTRRG